MSRHALLEQLVAEPRRLTGLEVTPSLLSAIAGLDPSAAYARLRLACEHGHAERVAPGRYRITTGFLPALRALVCPKHQGQPARTEEAGV